MCTNAASEAQIITSSPSSCFVFKQAERLICKYCGSILDKNFKHTEEWIRSWRDSGVQHRSRMYRVWGSMRERCNNPKQCRYSSYGGRGIKVCDEWKDFAKFREWALSAGYAPGLQVDRKDNDKGYNPENCRIATRHEQQQNRRLPSRHKTGKRYARRFFTEDDVYAIRESKLNYSALGRIYDIHSTHARNIKLRRAWRDLPERASTNH